MSDAVKCLLREYADNPLVFSEVPQWLQDAVQRGDIVPEFRSEDYWYYIVNTDKGRVAATPGDFIVCNPNGTLSVSPVPASPAQ
jgi:hypothetical protein